MNILLNEKELQVVANMVPGKTAEEVVNIVIRDWFNANINSMYRPLQPTTEVVDAVLLQQGEDLIANI